MADPAVQIEIGANVGRLRTDLEVANSTMRGFAAGAAKDLAGAMGPVGDAMRSGQVSSRGFIETLKDFRREQVQQGRQARFLAGEIASLIPATDGARGTMEGFLGVLIEGAAGGLSFGLALEAIKLGVGLVTGWLEESAKRSAEILKDQRERAEAAAASIRDLGRAIDAINGVPLTATEQEIRKVTDEANEKIEKQRQLLKDMEREGRSSSTLLGDPTKNALTGGESADYAAAKAKLVAMEADYQEQVRRLGERGANERRELAQKGLQDEEIAQIRRSAAAIKADGGLRSEILAIRKNLEADLKALDADRSLQDNVRETKRIHLENWADQEILRLRRSMLDQQERDRALYTGPGDVAGFMALDAQGGESVWGMRKPWNMKEDLSGRDESAGQDLSQSPEIMLRAAEGLKRVQEEMRQATEQAQSFQRSLKNVTESFAESVGSAFAAVLKGTKSFDKAMGDLAEQLIKMAAEMVVDMMAAELGPFAPALKGFIRSFDVGAWDLPVDTLAVVHRGEMIVPAAGGQADAARAILSGRAAGGGRAPVVVQLQALDHQSFESALGRHDSALVRVLEQLSRDGRIS